MKYKVGSKLLLAGLCCGALPAFAQTEVYLFGGQSNARSPIDTGFTDAMLANDPTLDLSTSIIRFGGRGLDAGWDYPSDAWPSTTPADERDNFFGGTDASDPNIGDAYTGMINYWQDSLDALTEPYEIKGIFWIHGEQDSKNATTASSYAANLDHLITRIHEDLGQTQGSVNFYYSSMESRSNKFTYGDTLRQQQLAADKDSGDAASISNAVWVSAAGLDYANDNIHYTDDSRYKLGSRFASAVGGFPVSTINVGFTSQAINGDPHAGTIGAVAGDLLESATLSSATYFNNADAAGAASLTDGQIDTTTGSAAVGANGQVVRLGAGHTLEFDLDVSTNTLGYDITSIQTIAAWGDSRAGQAYTVYVSYVGSSDFVELYRLPEQGASNEVSSVELTDTTGKLAVGVDAIRFEFADAPNNWSAYREIDVVGTPTVPEPSSLVMLGLGGLCMLKRRRLLKF